jgi:4-aminobutyrate aminotransferase
MAEDSPMVGEVRGRGLLLALEMVGPDGEPNPSAAVRFLQASRERGVLVGKGGINANAIRISPPLTITREAAEEAANVFEEALAEVAAPERVG